jgi:hypothetical protein
MAGRPPPKVSGRSFRVHDRNGVLTVDDAFQAALAEAIRRHLEALPGFLARPQDARICRKLSGGSVIRFCCCP